MWVSGVLITLHTWRSEDNLGFALHLPPLLEAGCLGCLVVVNTRLAGSEVSSCFSFPGSHLAAQEQELQIHKPHLTFTRALGIQAWILHSTGFTHWFNFSAHHPSILVNVFTSKFFSPRIGMVIYHYNPNTQETESRVAQDQGLPRLYKDFVSKKKNPVLWYTAILK